MQFVYPANGIEWIQADIGESGLADVRAQAGFSSEIETYFTLPGSGEENVRFLSESSNHGEMGSWWFLVGPLNVDSNIVQPIQPTELVATYEDVKQSCETHGHRCHANALCTNTELGFCCKCHTQFYGNGFHCLKKDQPVRVAGDLTGRLGSDKLESPIQAYVSVQDGRTYTAIRSLTKESGFKLQLLQMLTGPIGWLFAKPTGSVEVMKNGYELTGGKFNHTATVRFHASDRQVAITQRFLGMDAWDQLKVAIEIDGDLPDTPTNSSVVFPDFVEELVYKEANVLRSLGTYNLQLNDQDLSYSVIQQIDFERCPFDEDTTPLADRPVSYNKVYKITSSYTEKENALRFGESNKVTEQRDSNPCTDGTAVCGDSSVCVHVEHDVYEVRSRFKLFIKSKYCIYLFKYSLHKSLVTINNFVTTVSMQKWIFPHWR